MGTAQKKLIYLYCVTKIKPRQTNFKDMGIKIYPIYYQGVYAVVSKVSPDEFSKDNLKKNLGDMKWVEEKVRQHEGIIESIMQQTTVVPFKFGTVFLKKENIEKLLKERGTEFKKMMANLDGKEEWGLKIYCKAGKFKDSIEKEDERVNQKDKEVAAANKGRAYFLKKQRDELAKDIVSEKISEYTRDSFDRLKRVSLDTKINKILPRQVTDRKDDMVLNAAFLVNTKRIKEFESILKHLKTKYFEKGFDLDCTGPWPPYNFCQMKT